LVCKLDIKKLEGYIEETNWRNLDASASVNFAADQLGKYLEGARNACMPARDPPRQNKKSVHWWNREIADLRQEYLHSIRQHTNAQPDGTRITP